MNPLCPHQVEMFRRLLGCLIPAGGSRDLPGADDAAIADEIMATLTGRGVEIAPFVDMLNVQDLESRSTACVQMVVERLRSVDEAAFEALIVALAQCYYRDDRVLEKLGMEARAPFPKGFEVDQGDWSLLEPVRARGPIWRAT